MDSRACGIACEEAAKSLLGSISWEWSRNGVLSVPNGADLAGNRTSSIGPAQSSIIRPPSGRLSTVGSAPDL
jgi:hypothetical protein